MLIRTLLALMTALLMAACGSSSDPIEKDLTDDAPTSLDGEVVPEEVGAPPDEVDACVPDCEGKECGHDGCGGPCGECDQEGNWGCVDGLCLCEPACEGKLCGDDGCGGECGECHENADCVDDSCQCKYAYCAESAGVEEGGGCCDSGQVCNLEDMCCWPDCDGKECGEDGCGGSCGECDDGKLCTEDGACGCEYEGCDGACCEEGEGCIDGVCCQPDCEGKECGDDGCGQSCGDCLELYACSDEGLCACEFEFCGGACCGEGEVCAEGLCCLPDCEGKVCGLDSCGVASCGECNDGYDCAVTEDGTECSALCGELCGGFECGSAGTGDECDCGVCDDGNLCTDDTCGEDHACVFAPNAEACDDGNLCTGGDVCADGACAGVLLPVEELAGLDCLCADDAECLPLEDGDVCNGTLHCDLGSESPVCVVDPDTILDCDDGVECTEDSCDAEDGCEHVAVPDLCDDGNECTTEVCIPLAGCITGKLDDGTPCGDGGNWQCVEAECVCLSTCNGAECGEDGCGGVCGECDVGCVCAGGMCLGSCGPCEPECDGKACGPDGCGAECGVCGANENCNTETWACDPGECSYPTEFPGTGLKFTYLKAGTSGHAGEAIDVDNDPDTCAPSFGCSQGRDNQFAAFLKSIAIALGGSEPLVESVESGKMVLMFELKEPAVDGTQFMANIYRGQPLLPKEECDFQAETCDFYVLEESFREETCLPVTSFDNAQMLDGKLTAGGPGFYFAFPFVLGLAEGQAITFTASHTRIIADYELDEEGNVVLLDGIIGCAITKEEMLSIAYEIPEDKLPGFLTQEIVAQLLDMVAIPDIDADGDGVKESVSAGMKFTAIPGNLVGLEP